MQVAAAAGDCSAEGHSGGSLQQQDGKGGGGEGEAGGPPADGGTGGASPSMPAGASDAGKPQQPPEAGSPQKGQRDGGSGGPIPVSMVLGVLGVVLGVLGTAMAVVLMLQPKSQQLLWTVLPAGARCLLPSSTIFNCLSICLSEGAIDSMRPHVNVNMCSDSFRPMQACDSGTSPWAVLIQRGGGGGCHQSPKPTCVPRRQRQMTLAACRAWEEG
jgi:hypothetical protein